jgi:TRAP-type mannitol/chloroaromatic compound transport system substrate-binding protein
VSKIHSGTTIMCHAEGAFFVGKTPGWRAVGGSPFSLQELLCLWQINDGAD